MLEADKKKLLNEKVDLISKAVNEAQTLARELGTTFVLDIAYGMGGRYGPLVSDDPYDGILDRYDFDTEEEYEEALETAEYGWYSSSMSC